MQPGPTVHNNGPMRILAETRQDRPRKLGRAATLGVTAVALSMTLAACTSSSPSPAPSSSSSQSVNLHLSGHVVGDYTKKCQVGSDTVPNQVTVAFPDVAKVSNSPLNLVLYVPNTSSSTTYPASSTTAAVRLTTTKGTTYSWANNYPGTDGTMTVSSGGSPGSIDMTLVPIPLGYSPTNKATGNVHVQGSWADCTTT